MNDRDRKIVRGTVVVFVRISLLCCLVYLSSVISLEMALLLAVVLGISMPEVGYVE